MERFIISKSDNLKDKSGIYIIRNSISPLFYIGKSRNLFKRAKGHKTQLKNGIESGRLQKFYNENPDSVFYFDLIEYCPENYLKEFEEFWIESTNSSDPEIGFNKMIVSSGVLRHSQETANIISQKNREFYKNNPEKHPSKGKKVSEETKQRISEGVLRFNKDFPEKAAVGRNFTAEQKRKLSILKSTPIQLISKDGQVL